VADPNRMSYPNCSGEPPARPYSFLVSVPYPEYNSSQMCIS
jgi:hypothetical protein